jgi:hypothetical protein
MRYPLFDLLSPHTCPLSRTRNNIMMPAPLSKAASLTIHDKSLQSSTSLLVGVSATPRIMVWFPFTCVEHSHLVFRILLIRIWDYSLDM